MILDFYNRLSQDAASPHFTTFAECQGQECKTWWPDFINTYLAGDNMDFIMSNLVYPEPVDWAMDNEEDKTWSKTKAYPDVCSDLYRFSFVETVLPENASLDLHVESSDLAADRYELQVYTWDGNMLNLLGRAGESDMRVGNMKAFAADGNQMILALVKSHFLPDMNGSHEISIQAEIRETGSSSFNYGSISAKFWGYTHNTDINDNEDGGEMTIRVQGSGTMVSENTFYCEDERSDANGTTVNTKITIVFDPVTTEVVSFSGEFTQNNSNDGSTVSGTITGSGPISITPDPYHTSVTSFILNGSDVCGTVSQITYAGSTPRNSYTLTSWSCHGDAKLEIMMTNL